MHPLLALFAGAVMAMSGPAEPYPTRAAFCSFAGPSGIRSRTTTVVLARATGDTVLAGAGEILPSRDGGHSGTAAPGPIYGQVVEITMFGGADSVHLAAAFRLQPMRALIVPWDYDSSCAPARWTGGFAWLATQPRTNALTLKLRPDSLWVDGLPVFDAFVAVHEPYPIAHRGTRRAPDESPIAPWLTAEQFFHLVLAMPPHEDWEERPDSSWTAVTDWVAANPRLAERYPAPMIARQIAASIAGVKQQRVLLSIEPPIVGTYRLSLFLGDDSTRTLYIRTRSHPQDEWRRDMVYPSDPLVEPIPPTAYNMIASAARSVEALPTDCVDTRDLLGEGYVYVIDPPSASEERRTTWQGWLELSLVTRPFRNDTALEDFRLQASNEWAERQPGSADLEAPARFWYDGGILRVEQTTRLADGRALLLRGSRISSAVIACDW